MLSAVRKRMHVSPATAIATLALVFAMTGGAYAANRYLITSTKQISPKVLKSLKGAAGKAGAAGATGAAGPAGSQGPAGAAGPAGPKGETGAPGTPGTPGTPGKEGKEGSPWTAGGVLPSKRTETGAWNITVPKETPAFLSIGFTIPLAEGLGKEAVHYVGAEGNGTTCPGTDSNPEALPGNFCMYQTLSQNFAEEESHLAIAHIFPAATANLFVAQPGTSPSGVLVNLARGSEEDTESAWGTWAVTAP